MREDYNASDGDDPYDDDDDYEDDDEYLGRPDFPWPPPGQPGQPGPRDDGRARHAILVAVIAVVAAAVGFLVVIAVRDVSATPAAANDAVPSASATPGSSGGNQLPQGSTPGAVSPPGSGQAEQVVIAGKVAAVSATSITLDGAGQQITATVTGATKVTGRVTSIAGVKPGDLVSAQLTGTGEKLTAAAIQDPASLP
jgi:hypothetical protein